MTDKPLSDFDYLSQWRQVDSLMKINQPKSTLDLVMQIKKHALLDQRASDFVRATFLQADLAGILNENGLESSLAVLKQELNGEQVGVEALLYSRIGELYHRYAQENAWRLPNDEADTEVLGRLEDLSRQALLNRADSAYLKSIVSETQAIPLADFSKLIISSATPPFYEVIYDLLARRAMLYFSQLRLPLPQPLNKFRVDNPAYFSPISSFATLPIEGDHSRNPIVWALKIFQEVLLFHQADDDPSVLVDWDLQRLQTVYERSISTHRDSLYMSALQQLHTKYEGSAAHAHITAVIARHMLTKDDGHKPDLLKGIRAQCLDAIDQYPESYGAVLCKGVIAGIEAKSLDVRIEEVVLPDESSLVLLSYRNVERVFIKVARLPENDQQRSNLFNERDEDALARLTKMPVIYEHEIDCPGVDDFRAHKTEFAIPGQDNGSYAVLVGTQDDLSMNGSAVAVAKFVVSRISVIEQKYPGTSKIRCFDRLDGSPISQAIVTWYQYDQENGQRVLKKKGNAVTDSLGEAQIPKANVLRRGYGLLIKHGKDQLWIDHLYNYPMRPANFKGQHLQLFTDRSIYRPGQTIYYKGIAIVKGERGRPAIIQGKDIRISLIDANGQEISSNNLRTNDYGSIAGSFTLPQDGLKGGFRLSNNLDNSHQLIQVEAYKRPTFFVELNQPSAALILGDTVDLTGTATSYAGVSLGTATVQYRVVRKATMRYFHYGRGWPLPQEPDEEVANGEVQLNADGQFEFSFPTQNEALPTHPWIRPMYLYEVTADVTDVNGETHTQTLHLNLGEDPFHIRIPMSNHFQSDSLREIEISTLNFVNEPVAVNGSLKIIRIQGPAKWKKDRRWQMPDKTRLSLDSMNSLFPNYHHQDSDPANWPVIRVIKELPFDSKGSIQLALDDLLEAGHYRFVVEASNEQGSSSVTTSTTIYEPGSSEVPKDEMLFLPQQSLTSSPGSELLIPIATAIEGKIFWQIERQGNLETGSWIEANGWTQLQVPVTTADLGGFTIHVVMGVANRVVQKKIHVMVPWSHKDLKITYYNFRDKTRPGATEKLRLTIDSDHSQKLWTELLVGMYDASLDQFVPHQWTYQFYPTHHSSLQERRFGFGISRTILFAREWMVYAPYPSDRYPAIASAVGLRGSRHYRTKTSAPMAEAAMRADESLEESPGQMENEQEAIDLGTEVKDRNSEPVRVRSNFNETAFFFPQLRSDSMGNLSFEFEMNDALTTWRMMTLGHTQDLEVGYHEAKMISQKELMITPNSPRFLRAGDDFTFVSKIDNLSEKPLSAAVRLHLKNPFNEEDLNYMLGSAASQMVDIAPKSSTSVAWPISVPLDFLHPITYTIEASSEQYTDAQKDTWIILQNRKLVTESLAMAIAPGKQKTRELENLVRLSSETIQHTNLAVDVVANPAWYALQAMPYVMEYPHESSEQILNRYLIGALAQEILIKHKDIQETIAGWNLADKSANPLLRDENLKSAAIDETPWVQDAISERVKMAKLSHLFDPNSLSYEMTTNLSKLIGRQSSDGGFSWFPGGRSNWFITQYVLEGLRKIQQNPAVAHPVINDMLTNGIRYIDQQAWSYFENVKKRIQRDSTQRKDDQLSSMIIHYLYTRSLYKDHDFNDQMMELWTHYLQQAEQHWPTRTLYEQGLLAIAFHRNNKEGAVELIIKSLRERMLEDGELGPHWKYSEGHHWYHAPIEAHVMLMEVFDEVESDHHLVESLKVWLINQKRTTRWSSTKSTTAAIRALASGPNDWFLETSELPEVVVGERSLPLTSEAVGKQNLVVRHQIPVSSIRPTDGRVTMKNSGQRPIWGSVFWQYLEDLDKVSAANQTPVTVKKKLFLEQLDEDGRKLVDIGQTDLVVGDKVVVQLVVTTQQNMEFVHIQDQRAGTMEPISVISRYHWESGLGYYKSTSDTYTDFFVDYLPKGRYVLEYTLRVAQEGEFSNGIGTVQSMYAPEFASQTKGIRIKVGPRQ
ncbi:MAG: hypothetical protein HKN87_03215 [Saprospiraceae bacterium]|nr:hypothetical protein [Saprospiraceae bacterium]